jgi:hypothetical protein
MTHSDVFAWQSICSRCGREGACPPVIGDPQKFLAVSSLWRGIHDWCLEIESLIGTKLAPEACGGEFEGRTAEAVAAIQAEVREAMRCLPDASAEIDKIFSHHARELEALQQRATQALQRARLAREALDRADSQVVTHNRQVAYLERQLAALSSSCEPGAPDLVQATRSLDQEHSALRIQMQRAGEALGDLETVCVHETLQLRSEEESLNRHTVRALNSVPLGSLRDPRWWHKPAFWLIVSVLFSPGLVVSWLLIQAILDGPIGAALWWLSKFLGKYWWVVLAIILVVAFAAAILTVGFKAAVFLAALKIALPLVSLYFKFAAFASIGKFALTLYYYFTNDKATPDGKEITREDIVQSGLSALFSVIALGSPRIVANLHKFGKVGELLGKPLVVNKTGSSVIRGGAEVSSKIFENWAFGRRDVHFEDSSPVSLAESLSDDSWTSCETRIPNPSGTIDVPAAPEPGRVGGGTTYGPDGQGSTPPTVEFELSHVVAPGEGLWNVAERYYGDGTLWPEIAVANGIDPGKWQQDYQNNIHPGQTITVPVIEILIPEIWEVSPHAPHARVEDLVGV